MKTLLKLLCFVACIAIITSCQKEEEILRYDTELKSGHLHTVTVPFKADFVNTYVYVGPSPNPEIACGEWDPENGFMWGMVIGEGEGAGNATHLGKFSHRFEFCVDLASGIYPGPSGHMKAHFVAANGDTLFVRCEGQVLDGRLDHHPEDADGYFTDPWEVIRGTGRFEGATGGGMTDDYNRDLYPQNSFHHWTGTITLVKGKRK